MATSGNSASWPNCRTGCGCARPSAAAPRCWQRQPTRTGCSTRPSRSQSGKPSRSGARNVLRSNGILCPTALTRITSFAGVFTSSPRWAKSYSIRLSRSAPRSRSCCLPACARRKSWDCAGATLTRKNRSSPCAGLSHAWQRENMRP